MAMPFAPAVRRYGAALRKAAKVFADASGWGPPSTPRPSSGYEGASQAPRMSGWWPTRLHINAILAAEAPLLRARVRNLIANTPYGANASETFATYAVGAGIQPSPLLPDAPELKKAIKQAWSDWCDEADADGVTDFYGLQALISRAMFDAGECFVRLRPRFARDGLTVPLQLQVIESEQLDTGYTVLGPNGNQIRMGIEFDAIGRRVAYWFFPTHPGDGTIFSPRYERTRVPADQVLHLYKPLRIGQIRGRPWLTPGMVKLRDLDDYDDAELVRKKGAATFMAAITKSPGADIGETGLVDEVVLSGQAAISGDPNPTEVTVRMEPGETPVLPDGFDMKFNNPADVGPNYEAFQYRNLLALCAAMGLPYFAVSSDTSKANYSSLRSAVLEVQRRIEQFQWNCLIFQLCRPVYEAWLPAAILSGAVSIPGYARDPRSFSRVKWITPKWPWVDPLKDTQAEKLAVDAGFKARSDVIEAYGEDPEDTDARIAADHAREGKLGLSFQVGFTRAPDQPGGADTQQQGQGDPAAAAVAELRQQFEALGKQVERTVAALQAKAAEPPISDAA